MSDSITDKITEDKLRHWFGDGTIDYQKRNADIEARFISGETLQAIGDVYHITRERVRQILAKRGINSELGGAKLTRRMKRMETT